MIAIRRVRCRTVPGQGNLETWELEEYLFERLARRLRTVGDGFAWPCFGYDRRIILALSRNESPGPMYGKKGLPYELGAIQEMWRTRQHFALHHDLTNCLPIADLTEFTAGGSRLFHEIKAKPRTEQTQLERALLGAAKDIHQAHPDDVVSIVVGSSSQATHRMLGSAAVSLARHSRVPVVIAP